MRNGGPFDVDEDAADRHLACQIDLEPEFTAIVEAEPERNWTGDEAAFWPIRAGAVHRGWSPEEIDDALQDLAAYRHLGRLANRITDAQIAAVKRMLAHPESIAAPPPRTSLRFVLLGAGLAAGTIGIAWWIGAL